MGLLIKLQNGDTQLKSLKFGSDRLGGGDSGQPYIQTSVDTEPGQDAGTDFLLRGGINAPADALTDVKRLTKYMFDLKSPSGGLFVAKQNLLSRVSPKTEASKGLAYAGGALNNGVYTPLSTLAQAGIGFLGGHIDKQGLDPTGLFPGLSINKYETIIKSQDENNFQSKNRLINLKNSIKNFDGIKGYSLNQGSDLITYGGGPGSILGVGQTHIRYADQRTGVNNPQFGSKVFEIGGKPIVTPEIASTYYSPIENILNEKNYNRQLVSLPQFDEGGLTTSNASGSARTWGVTSASDGKLIERYSSFNTLKRDFTDPNINDKGGSLWKSFNAETIKHKDGYLADLDKNAGSYKDGEKTVYFSNGYPGGIAPDFRLVSRSLRGLNEFTQFNKNDSVDNGETSTRWIDYNGSLNSKTLDQIYYSGSINKSSFRTSNLLKSDKNGEFNDIIKFRISIINPQLPNNPPTVLNFRAYIDSLSDSYSADWKSQTYMGRGEKFYKYNSFDRDMSLAFTIVADNYNNLLYMYDQLNTLAASLAPTYTGQGYMAGNLHKLTIGNYVYEQPGILTSLTYDIMDESPWELDETYQLPYYIKVTGIKFIPIHEFRPESEFNRTHAYINQ
jgi:hypothetical protein